VIELADFQRIVVVCLVVVGHVHPRCSRKKRTGESREKNAGSVTEQRGRQQRRPSVHAVKHRSTSRTNTDVSARSTEKCPLSVERSKEAQLCSSGSVRELNVRAQNLSGPKETRKRKNLQLALHAHACSSRCTLSVQQACCTWRDPLRGEIREVGRGLSLADTQTGRYGRLYSRRRLCARRGSRRTSAPPDPSLTSSLRLRQVQELPERNSPYN
jgi:hypothetical protein